MEQVKKRNEDFMEPLMEAQKEDAKERERGREFLFEIRGVLKIQLKTVNYFLKKAPS